MTKHLHLKKVLATLLTIVAVFAGQQASATITDFMSIRGQSANINGQYYYVWSISGFMGQFSQSMTQGNSYTFNGQNIGLNRGDVHITGTLNFAESNELTDVTTGSQVTIVFSSDQFWFYGATVKKLDGTNVTDCSASASSDHTSITITIPSGKTFGNIYLDFVAYEPFYNYNTTISGVESTYIYTGRPIEPVPTVIYNGTVLTAGTDYTVSYSNTTGPGSASVTVTGTGQYAGTVTRNYNIRAVALTDFTSLGNNTYAIATTADLDHLAGYVKLDNDCQGLTFKQTADITYSHGSSTTENNFTPIGGYFGGDKNFSGTYDGQNHTISGIRVYKDPTNSGNAYKNVALFGRISGATIQNVILTDARITGYRYVGGLVGNKASGTVQNCLVVGSTITCGNTYGGALFGSNNGTLTANHYRNCTVNNTTNATNVGVGNDSSSSDMAGARSMHPLTIQNANVTATGESVVIDGTTYYASNTTVTLGYSGTVPAGQMPVYSVNGTAIEGNTFTMPTNDNATVSATFVSVWSGSGTSGSPYVITTTAQLDALAAAVKSGETYSGTYFVLGNDIAYSTEGLGDTDENFIPIGGYFDGSDKNFSGTFNGQNHTISGIRLYKNGTAAPSMNQGLFGRIDGATIENVILADARITGYRYVGGLVGNKVSGTVQNCLVLESTITCANTYVGALFGKNNGTITSNYYHNCTVNGTAVSVGVGGNGGVSSSSDTDGARSVHTLTIQNGDITATGSTVAYQGTTYYASNTTVTLGYNNLLEGCVATYSLDGNILTGNTFTMPAADATVNGSFVSHWHADADHDGTTEERAYIITTTAGLDLLATKVNGGTDYYHKFFKLGADIAYDGTENNYTAIGNSSKYFIGTFDGDGYAVSGIHINTSGNYQGLFGYVGYTGTVKNVTLRSSTITGMNYVGGIVGFLYRGTVTDCRVESTVTIGTYDNGSKYHGGIVGASGSATVNGCISAATVTNNGKSGCYYYGGIVGQLSDGTISNNLALGANVSANNYKGAIVGYRSNGTLANNYYHGCTVGGATSGIGTNSGDVSEDDGAVQVFSLTLDEGITATPAPAVTYNNINYYTTGTEITLNANEGYAITSATLTYGGNDYPIVGNSFEMPAQDVAVTAVLQVRYTFNSTTGVLALLRGEFNKDNKWGSEVTESAVTSVTATDEVSFTGDCYELFYNFTSCTSMDLTDVNTDNLTNIRCMFWGCQSLTTLNLSSWNTAAVTEMTSAFRNCTGLTSLNLSGWNTANVTNMIYMFLDCSSLQSLDLSGWNTANVINMSSMFEDCVGLQSLDLSGWNTANVTNMNSMFENCWGLQSLNVSGWNTANVTNMSNMFYNCESLQSLDLSGWNTANVTNMNTMFLNCSGLESLDVSNWNTANVTDMSNMFCYCESLQSLNLLGWNTANVTNMNTMFLNCSGLATIYVGEDWNTSRVNWSNDMFYGCTSLVGGMGTAYNSNHTNAEYARIDGGPDNPGYFTAPFTKEIAGYGNDENPGGYYLIASPVGTVNPENVGNMTANAFDLYRFNQSADLEWENWKDQDDGGYDLVSGKGYLYANSDDVTLTFTGTPVEGDTYEVTLTRDDNAEFAGWNLVGNPFTKTAYIQGNQSFYTMNADGSNLVASTSTSIEAMEGVFVIANTDGETLTFTTNAPNQGKKQIVLNVTQGRGNVIDRAIVRFGQSDLLPKFMLNPNDSKVYIPMDGNNFAVMCSSNSSRLPVCFEPSEDGTYFINVDIENVAVRYLHLIDHEMGMDIDLLREPSYKFDAKAEGKPERFELVVKTNFKQYKEAFSRGGDSDNFAFISNGEILIDGEGTLQVIDMMGRIVVRRDAARHVSTNGMTPGVYVLRLIDGDTIRTQKIVIE